MTEATKSKVAPTNKTTPNSGAIMAVLAGYFGPKLGLDPIAAGVFVYVLTIIFLAFLPDSIEGKLKEAAKGVKWDGIGPGAIALMFLLGGCSAIGPSLTFEDGEIVKVDSGTYALLDGLPGSTVSHRTNSILGIGLRELAVGMITTDLSAANAMKDGETVAPLRREQVIDEENGIGYDLTIGAEAFDE